MKPSICVVTCYKQPDYVRAISLRDGVRQSGRFSAVWIVKNRRTGILRYAEVTMRLMMLRLTKNPDVYLLTFRGYELLPVLLLIAAGKKVVYDEFINPYEWFVYEHKKFSERSLPARLLRGVFRWCGKRVTAIVTDTPSHADYSATLMGLPRALYHSIPVSTDEATFYPQAPTEHEGFQVLYYGNMLPLHGVQYVIEAAELLADDSSVTFRIVGGKQAVAERVKAAAVRGARIEYTPWVPYAELPALFRSSDLCLGGPFGGTLQSQFVVTGKSYQFLAAARPVVIGANKESAAFRDKHDALIVPQADARALAEAIRWAKAHPAQLARIAQNGRTLYESMYSTRRVADELRRLFTAEHGFDMEG